MALDAPLRVMVAPLPLAAGVTVPEILQVCPWTIVTAAPLAALATELPSPAQATLLLIPTEEDVFEVEVAIVSVTVATTPFEIAVELDPEMTQVGFPAVLLHMIDLFAALLAGPAAILTPEKSEVK